LSRGADYRNRFRIKKFFKHCNTNYLSPAPTNITPPCRLPLGTPFGGRLNQAMKNFIR
jgi:hypothetical protein